MTRRMPTPPPTMPSAIELRRTVKRGPRNGDVSEYVAYVRRLELLIIEVADAQDAQAQPRQEVLL